MWKIPQPVYAVAVSSLLLTSCEQEEGPAEKMGKKIDEAAEEAKEEFQQMKEEVEERHENWEEEKEGAFKNRPVQSGKSTFWR